MKKSKSRKRRVNPENIDLSTISEKDAQKIINMIKQKQGLYNKQSNDSSSAQVWGNIKFVEDTREKTPQEIEILNKQKQLEEEMEKRTKVIISLEQGCKSSSSSVAEKLDYFKKLHALDKLTSSDILKYWQDIIPYLNEQMARSNNLLLKKIILETEVEEGQKLEIITSLYNRGFIYESFELFKSIALNKDIKPVYRVEACKYLISGKDPCVEEILEKVVSDHNIKSSQRYEFIRLLNQKSDFIFSIFNDTKLRVERNDKLIKNLLTIFFNDKDNELVDIIKSGQSLIINYEGGDDVCNILLNIAKNTSLEEGVRARAADVVHRLGSSKLRKEALLVISQMGTGDDLLKTIYENSQNVHSQGVSNSVQNFIEELIDNTSIGDSTPETTIKEIKDQLRKTSFSKADKGTIKECLNRILCDEAVFTKFKITSAECLVFVWKKINNSKDQKDLEMRLFQELLEIPDDCSTGYITRIINTIPDAIKISWEEQIHSNIIGRVSSRLRDVKAEDVEYKKLLDEACVLVKKEMTEEFVSEGHLSLEEFNSIFEKWEIIIKQEWGV